MTVTQMPRDDAAVSGAAVRVAEQLRAAGHQILVIGAAFGAYMGVRALANGSEALAFVHAGDILRFEEWLGIDFESTMQRFVLDRPSLEGFFNVVYAWMYWPTLIGTLLFTWFKRRDLFRLFRDAVMISGGIGLAVFALYPVAPPRFLDGFVDTVDASDRANFIAHPSFLINKFAALPSFHVGWVALAAVVLMMATQSPARRAAIATAPVLMGIAVVVTGNHYIVDIVAGLGICSVALLLARRLEQRRSGADRIAPGGKTPLGLSPR